LKTEEGEGEEEGKPSLVDECLMRAKHTPRLHPVHFRRANI
jgi:hypothetical protein